MELTRNRAGSRGGNVRSVAEARALQEAQKEKDRWSGLIDLQIEQTLLSTGVCHANDLDDLGVPPAHCNLIGTRMARFRNKGYMEPTTERRKVTHPAANGRRNPVYRITAKGWKELKPLAGVSAGVPSPQGTGAPVPAFDAASTDSGENSRVEGRGEPGPENRVAASPLIGSSAAVKALDSASPSSKDQRGRDPQVRGEGCSVSGFKTWPRQPMPPDERGTTQPARLSDSPEALSLLPEVPNLFDHDAPRAA